jgi:hypothetical protein
MNETRAAASKVGNVAHPVAEPGFAPDANSDL